MTLERILHAAVHSLAQGKRSPHCFSAHVPGKGYVNDGTVEADRPEYVRQAVRAAQSEVDNLGYAVGYSEPGYTDSDKGVLFANWNHLPRGLDTILERAGYAIEWSDEWTTCEDCNKAIRTSPDSYSWQRNYADEEGSVICHACLDPADHLLNLEDDPTRCNTIEGINPADHRYSQFNGRFESGWHPGQDDDPKQVYAQMQALGHQHIVFNLDTAQQFDTHWSAWYRVEEEA